MKSQIRKLIKIIATMVIVAALGLVGWNLYLHFQSKSLSTNLISLFWLGNIVLVAHTIEAVIAAIKAVSQAKNPWKYGIYTFFVGFIGLQELSEHLSINEE